MYSPCRWAGGKCRPTAGQKAFCGRRHLQGQSYDIRRYCLQLHRNVGQEAIYMPLPGQLASTKNDSKAATVQPTHIRRVLNKFRAQSNHCPQPKPTALLPAQAQPLLKPKSTAAWTTRGLRAHVPPLPQAEPRTTQPLTLRRGPKSQPHVRVSIPPFTPCTPKNELTPMSKIQTKLL